MAEQSAKAPAPPSRLRRRAPASIQVTPVSNWNVAIPLLSPLATSAPDVKRNCSDNSESECRRVVNCDNKSVSEPEKAPIVYKNWQHPAAPFFYEPAPTLLQSICSGVADRS